MLTEDNSFEKEPGVRPESEGTLVERLDVRTKLAVLALFILATSLVKDLVWGSLLFIAAAALCFAIGRGRTAAKMGASYLALVALFWASTLLPSGIGGAFGSFILFSRTIMPTFLIAAVFVTSTKTGDLMAALCALHLPRTAVIPFVVALRYAPTLREEARAVSASMKLRGLSPDMRNVLTRPGLIAESLIVPIMLRSAKIADELAAAAVARGIDRPGTKTSFRAPAFRLADGGTLAASALMCGTIVALRLSDGIGGIL